MKLPKPGDNEKRSLIFYTVTFLLFVSMEELVLSAIRPPFAALVANAYLLMSLLALLIRRFYRYFRYRNPILRYFFAFLLLAVVLSAIFTTLKLLFPSLLPFGSLTLGPYGPI